MAPGAGEGEVVPKPLDHAVGRQLRRADPGGGLLPGAAARTGAPRSGTARQGCDGAGGPRRVTEARQFRAITCSIHGTKFETFV
ncbi:hypothetical protein GCM10011534_26920 [Pseudooceanicola nanhaiensis]|uniref:Uncharacterized protein n=1 Tax=Pseudooceanicola nanhaiensis TaxID=375761 RepID=A0A917SYF8_9RHOB|nr:hypothetical protein GCM10011534_26920 [Pseudooceanicola nanhaiensis]